MTLKEQIEKILKSCIYKITGIDAPFDGIVSEYFDVEQATTSILKAVELDKTKLKEICLLWMVNEYPMTGTLLDQFIDAIAQGDVWKREEMKNKVSESIYYDNGIIIPLADVMFIEKHYYGNPPKQHGIKIIMKNTIWNIEADTWANNAYISDVEEKDKKFLKAWTYYRFEIEGGKDGFKSSEDKG